MEYTLLLIIFIGFFLRLIIAIWNGFFGPSPGADFDAEGLNRFASDVARTGVFDDVSIGYTPYTNFLGIIYSYTINHIFIGSLLSCFIWVWSAFLIKKCFKLI